METEEKLNTEILKITLLIQDKYPELAQFISEMPVTNPDKDNPKINIKILQEYYNSLESLLLTYTTNHTSTKQ